MANLREISEMEIKVQTIPNELTRQLGVLRLLTIVQQRQQPISLSVLGAIFIRQSEPEEKQVVGSTLSDIMLTMKVYSNIFVLDRLFQQGTHPEIHVRLVDDASAENLLLLGGVLKVKGILKLKGGKLKTKQLSTFYNQQSCFEERKIMGRNPKTLAQTIQALSRIFEYCDDFVSIKVDEPRSESPKNGLTPTSQDDEESSDSGSQTGSITTCSEDAPISYASAVTAHTIKDDDISRARRTGISKIRNYLAQFGTSTFSHLLYILEIQGTPHERQAVGTDLKTLQATLQGLYNIFAVTDQFVDLANQTPRVNGLTRIVHFLKAKGSCEVVQIVGFMGQGGALEEREALGKNPQSLRKTLQKFPNIFVFNGSQVSLKWKGHSQIGDRILATDGFGGITSYLSPTFLHERFRNESIGVDSGYEGSVTLDQPDIDASKQITPDSTNQCSKASEAARAQFTIIDVAHNHDHGFKNFKADCLDSCNEFEQPIIGLILSDDHKWMAISNCTDKVYFVDLETCSTSGSGCGDQNCVWDILKDVLESNKILKVVFDCHMVAAALRSRFGLNLSNVFDTMRAHEILTCDEPTTVNDLCNRYEGVTPPSKWSANIGGLPGWKVLDSGGHTSDIGLAASARVLVPHLYRRMMVRFTDVRLNEVLRLCEQIVQ